MTHTFNRSVDIPEILLEFSPNKEANSTPVSADGEHTKGDYPVIRAYFSGENLDFLKYEPMIFIERFKGRRWNNKDKTKPKKWVHPSHLDGTLHNGENVYGGAQSGDQIAGQITITERKTEFACPVSPYAREIIDVNPNYYFKYRVVSGSPSILPRGRGISLFSRSKTVWFRASIVLRDRSKVGKDSYIWGPRSSVFGFRARRTSGVNHYWHIFNSFN